MFTDLSVDLETLGTEPGCVITQIGLCAFNPEPTGSLAATVIRVDPQSCLDAGMHVSWSTISWWLQQEQAAREFMVAPGGHHLHLAITQASAWMKENLGERFKIWGHGATFDVTLLTEAYRIAKVPVPWQFRDVRDLRTLIDLPPCALVPRPVPKVEHNAMDDAVAQAKWVQACLHAIEKGTHHA